MLTTALATAASHQNAVIGQATLQSLQRDEAPRAPVAPRREVFDAAPIAAMLQQLNDALQPQRRIVHAGDRICQAGTSFGALYVLNSGVAKVVNLAADGREQVVGLKFRGDWLGFDGIAQGCYACDAIALDTGEVWVIRYEALLAACAARPALLALLHGAMSREIAGDRDSMMSVCTLPADARVADFLRHWAEALAQRGLRTDQITLRMTRAEIGNFLGMTLETVSRALSRLAREGLIIFAEKGRRDVRIPEVTGLVAFVQSFLATGTVQ
ncbi:Crp/Fnr family transcriptional regulator [Pseudaquabacterium terrae]|nr:helix-turn-helix domain-containing protein [Aquabacterium terrae]